jgi:CHAT domain-containing protein
LAGGAEIRVGDVLALPRVPRLVVLSACEAARADSEARPESLGVAQAFVTRGAQAVIAPTRPIADTLAREMVAKLYQQRGALPVELTRAQRAIATAQPDADWAAYRVLVP